MSTSKDTPIGRLLENLPQIGALQWIGLRPKRREDVQSVTSVEVIAHSGLLGDHSNLRRPNPSGKRHVTLIQAEHLPAVASLAGLKEVKPETLRRNLLISGINLTALKDKRFRIGDDVILEGTGFAHPCSRMEEALGAGGYNAMRGHGGITARVIQGGMIQLGDPVRFEPGDASDDAAE